MVEEKGDVKSEKPVAVVYGNDRCQTYNAKWLCLENIYQKMYRPNMYDIGGTYINDVADFWFMYSTDQLADTFLLHVFICNRTEPSFRIGLSYSNDLLLEKKSEIAYLPGFHKTYDFKNIQENSYTYVTTYSFSELDVDSLKNKKLYISIKFLPKHDNDCNQEILDEVMSAHDFGAFLKDPIFSDFTIESADGEKFQVHKNILSAHSDVFKAMFKDETAESQNGFVKLIDVNKDDLSCILQFIYTGTVDNIMECNCINLLMLADKYDLRGLVSLTEHALSRQLYVDTAAEILATADMYNSCFLKTATMKYIKKNTSVLKTNGWKEIQNAALVREVCEYLAPSED